MEMTDRAISADSHMDHEGGDAWQYGAARIYGLAGQ
jgi:hypothetical protein